MSIEDACSAYIRAIEASDEISGIFNIASGNYTVGETADIVKDVLGRKLGLKIRLTMKRVPDIRNYKVSFDKAMNMLSFKPVHDVAAILDNLIGHRDKFEDLGNPKYYNIKVFEQLQSKNI